MARRTPARGRAPVVVGVDLGTGSAKAVAHDLRGRTLATASVPVDLTTHARDRAEQDPDSLLAAATQAVRRVVTDNTEPIAGIALSAAMHSLLAVGDDGAPLTPALVYADNRASDQVAQIAAETDVAELTERTGTPLHPMSPLAKLRWFAQEEPQIAQRARRWMSVKEYVLQRWCGEAVVDYSMAAATGLFNLRRETWDDGALALAGVDPARLSTPVATTTVLDGLSDRWAERLGVPGGTQVVVGASDGCLANLGTGAIEDGVAALTIGSSGAVRMLADEPDGDATGRLFCYPLLDGCWVVGGPISNGGLVLRWARDRLLPELAEAARGNPYELFTHLASEVPPGAGGLLFLPHLLGERAPQWDASLRAALLGVSSNSGREHVLRALLEGVAYQLALVVQAMESLGHRPNRFRASGGFTASPLWLQIVADVLERDVELAGSGEASCVGAALLGMQALGLGDAFDLARSTVQVHKTIPPDASTARTYRTLLAIYADVQERLAGSLHALGQHAGDQRPAAALPASDRRAN